MSRTPPLQEQSRDTIENATFQQGAGRSLGTRLPAIRGCLLPEHGGMQVAVVLGGRGVCFGRKPNRERGSSCSPPRANEAPSLRARTRRRFYGFASEPTQRRRVSDPTYHRAVDLLGTRAGVELVGILSYYTLISMTIVAFEVPLPPDALAPFATG